MMMMSDYDDAYNDNCFVFRVGVVTRGEGADSLCCVGTGRSYHYTTEIYCRENWHPTTNRYVTESF